MLPKSSRNNLLLLIVILLLLLYLPGLVLLETISLVRFLNLTPMKLFGSMYGIKQSTSLCSKRIHQTMSAATFEENEVFLAFSP